MKNKQIFETISKIKPDEEAKDRMLANILKQVSIESKAKRKVYIMRKNTLKKLVPIAACVAIVIVGAVAVPQMIGNKPNTQIELLTPAADSPSGIRKIFNFNGHRYAFIENGATFSLNSKELTEVLGILEHDIAADPQTNGSKDLATTFAVGGTIYKIPSYDAMFRVAVELDGNYYICENVDTLDGSEVNVSDYFNTADFANTTNKIEIYDHSYQNLLDTVPDKQTIPMINALKDCTLATLTNEDFEQIGKAQSEGKSFVLSLRLNDGTSFELYIIPSLDIAMIGDNRYTLPENFVEEYGSLFEDLNQVALPMH